MRTLDYTNRKGRSVAVRLRGGIHPKHLVEVPGHAWYLPFVRPEHHVLDLGCGTGHHAERVAQRCKVVWGFDATPPTPRGPNVYMLRGDVTAPLPFPDRVFDVVLLFDVLEHVHARQAMLGEIRRVLKNCGRLLVSAPNRGTPWRRRLREAGLFAYSDPDHKVEYLLGELLEELRRGGFVAVQRPLPSVYDTPWAGLLDALGACWLPLYGVIARWKHRRGGARPNESTGWRVVVGKAPEMPND